MTGVGQVAPKIEDVLALSPLQEGFFALAQLADESVDLYSMQFVVDIEGALDVDLLHRSAQAMLTRYPNLRASFWDQGVPKPVQIVPVHAELPWEELSARPADLDAIARQERLRPFDLSKGPAVRSVVVSVLGESRHRLIVTAHHILMDGWSFGVYFSELLAAYQAGGSIDGLPSVRSYRDYIAWLATQDTTAAAAQWATYLDKASGPLMLANGGVSAHDGVPEKHRFELSPQETSALRKWAGSNGFTLNTAVMFAWSLVLGRLSDRRDVVFGTIVSGRPAHLAGVEKMVGLFINAVPVVHVVDPAVSVVEQCGRLQRETSAMRDVGYLSLSALQRAQGGAALFDTMFVFENAPLDDAVNEVVTADGVRFRPVEGESLAHYPLTVVSHMYGESLLVVIEAIAEALPYFSAEDIGERLVSVLRQLPNIGTRTAVSIDVLTPRERAHVGAVYRDFTELPQSVWELFEHQVSREPSATALTAEAGQRLTYAQLHERACRLAAELAEHGVGPEVSVALLLPRSVDSIIAVLAVLAAGGAYVPVDISLPAARIESIIQQSNPAVVITNLGCQEKVQFACRAVVLDDPVAVERVSMRRAIAPNVRRHRDQIAYMIFTSGSTGVPKGVIGTHRALLSYFADHRDRVYGPATARLGRRLRIAHAWSLSFDASWQPMMGLFDGHAVHLFGAEEMRDARRLVQGMLDHDVDMIDTTPSMLAQLSSAGLLDRSIPVLALGGEAIDTALWNRLSALAGTDVYNCYGPTETTVEAVVAEVKNYLSPTIGTPNKGMAGYVLDSALRPLPDGAVGELYLAGPQLARGYAGKPALTAGAFVADPLQPGHRMYRTGDLVRRLPHGGFAYLGRADSQVKIRGYRVEVGEIESALRCLPGVETAAVSVVRRAGGASLVGFVVHQHDTFEPERAMLALADRLPSYMLPARLVVLSQLPVTVNGKLDADVIDRLAADALAGAAGDGESAPPTTVTEHTLSECFAELFDGTPPGIDADFFSLGVDSIVAISLVNKARKREVPITPRMVLAAPTIRQLAALVDSRGRLESIAGKADYGPVPPLPIVSWLHESGEYRRFALSVLVRLPDGIDRESIAQVLQPILDGHDMLRSLLVDTPEGPRIVTREPGVVRADSVITRVELPADEQAVTLAVTAAARAALDDLDPYSGSMFRAVWLVTPGMDDALLLCAHHLAVDVVSWHILLANLADAWRTAQAGGVPKAPVEFTSYRHWSQLMAERAAGDEVQEQYGYWAAQVAGTDPALGSRHPDRDCDTWATLRNMMVTTPVDITARLLAAMGKNDGVYGFLIAALAVTVASWRIERGQDAGAGTLIAVERHGRMDDELEADTTGTVGWFTSMFPARVGAGSLGVGVGEAERDHDAARAVLASVAQHLAEIPNQGMDYGLLRYADGRGVLSDAPDPQIQFNYLGRMDRSGITDEAWSLVTDVRHLALPADSEPNLALRFATNISVAVMSTPEGPQLLANWQWSSALFTQNDADRLAELWQRSVAALAVAAEL